MSYLRIDPSHCGVMTRHNTGLPPLTEGKPNMKISKSIETHRKPLSPTLTWLAPRVKKGSQRSHLINYSVHCLGGCSTQDSPLAGRLGAPLLRLGRWGQVTLPTLGSREGGGGKSHYYVQGRRVGWTGHAGHTSQVDLVDFPKRGYEGNSVI